MINVKLSGDAFKYKGSKNGVYYMQSGFSNGQRYWISSEGNAIWYSTDVDWSIGYSEDLGTTSAFLYIPIKDASKECPHENLKSNWWYYMGNDIVEDISNSVRLHCIRGKRSDIILNIQVNYEMAYFKVLMKIKRSK